MARKNAIEIYMQHKKNENLLFLKDLNLKKQNLYMTSISKRVYMLIN